MDNKDFLPFFKCISCSAKHFSGENLEKHHSFYSSLTGKVKPAVRFKLGIGCFNIPIDGVDNFL